MTDHQNSRPLIELTGFGVNPGNLKSWLYLPSILAPKTALVVVLHGCTQDAAGYDHGSGWTQLAEKNGFAVLFPEQQRSNNGNLCFNWFQPGDARRDSGEALSIREMVGHVVTSHGLDEERAYITGLSAGGAMALVMLATYPELFNGGAMIGSLPYGVAGSVDQAFQRMQGRNAPDPHHLRSALVNASPGAAARPKISVWHGTHDQIVRPVNAMQIVDQWSGAHGLGEIADTVETGQGFTRKVWRSDDGAEVVELYMVAGMGHGVPISASAKTPLGSSGPYMLDTGISSTARIARSWGLADDQDVADAEGSAAKHGAQPSATETLKGRVAGMMANMSQSPLEGAKAAGRQSVNKVITDALRAAGLMR
ncbi:PHB depolymerase family esterase [Rhizobium sp. FKL33]|uniref:extracellular catalytic domain type 1 short-chain-length polyhydroxyalkanoate depolymerase n=1 Tax=Rhizobium sp. FKL33 TaxID=2562307 RepID=UPI0010BF9F80|nr:PHB depolymerase family esterase [Rhizobium sp. FKL33]